MQPYMMPPPPPPKGSNTGLIVGLVLGIFALLFIGIFVCAGVMGYIRASRAARMSAYTSTPYTSPYATTTTTSTTTAPGGSTALSESYSTSNGLVTTHYPADFAAKSLDHATLMLSRNNSDGTDEVVEVAGVENPISNDVNEFSRILINMMKTNIEKAGDRWTETSRRRTTCFKSYPGLEVQGTFTAQGITKENVKICYFMRPGKGYELKTIVPAIHEMRDQPTLQSIIDATETK